MTIPALLRPALLAFSAVLLAAAPGAQAAQETAQQSARSEDAHEVLFAAIEGAVGVEASIDNQIETIKETYRQNSDFFLLDTLYPGLIDKVGEVMRPYLIQHSKDVAEAYRPRNIQTLRDHFTAEEAVQLTEFYRSPAGISLLRGFGEQYTGEAVLGDLEKLDDGVQMADVSRDIETAAMGSVRQMSREDLLAMARWFGQHPGLMAKLNAVGVANTETRAAMENEPMDPKLERHFSQAVEQAVAAHIASFEGEAID